MIIRKYREYITFLRVCYRMIAQEKFLFFIFLVVSFAAAISEGIGVTMLVPILESQANRTLFSDIPLLKEMSLFFEGMEMTVKLQRIAIVLGLILILRGFLLYFVALLAGIIPLRLQKRLFTRGYAAIMDVEYSYFTEVDIGEHSNSLNHWVIRVSTLITSLANIIFNSILLIVYMILMLSISWKLAILAGLFISFITFLLKKFTISHLRSIGKELSDKSAKVSEIIYETLAGMKFIKLSAGEDVMGSLYKQKVVEKIDAQVNMLMLTAVTHPFLTTISGIFICLVLYFGSYLSGGGDEWLSGLLFFLFIVLRLLSPVSQLNSARANIASQLFAIEQLEKFYVVSGQRKQPSGNKLFDGIRQEIKFENITFKYPNNDHEAINKLSLKILSRQMVAIVGPSGSGKSTLVSLLTRFYDPHEGHIKIDGVDLKEFDIRDYRRHISVVSQDVFIFNDTVSNNISFSLTNVSDEEIRQAATYLNHTTNTMTIT